MRARDMTPAQLEALDAVDKLQVGVNQARRQIDAGNFDVDTMRLWNLMERVDEAFSEEKCE